MAGLRNNKGFTLVELISVILVLAVVSVGLTSYIGFGIDIYRDSVGRDRQISDSRYLIERLTRELREALPNSIRVNADGTCVEFVPIVASSSYVDIPVAPKSSKNKVKVVTPANIPVLTSDTKMAVYPLNQSQVYADTSQLTGRIFDLTAINPSPGNNLTDLSFTDKVLFAEDSPTDRYFIVENAVAYCAVGSNVMRYANYWRTDSTFPPSGVSGVLMAERQASTAPFRYNTDTLIRNAMVQLDLKFSYDDELLELYHEVHIVNVP